MYDYCYSCSVLVCSAFNTKGRCILLSRFSSVLVYADFLWGVYFHVVSFHPPLYFSPPTFVVPLIFDVSIFNLAPSINFMFRFSVGFGASWAVALCVLGLFSVWCCCFTLYGCVFLVCLLAALLLSDPDCLLLTMASLFLHALL